MLRIEIRGDVACLPVIKQLRKVYLGVRFDKDVKYGDVSDDDSDEVYMFVNDVCRALSEPNQTDLEELEIGGALCHLRLNLEAKVAAVLLRRHAATLRSLKLHFGTCYFSIDRTIESQLTLAYKCECKYKCDQNPKRFTFDDFAGLRLRVPNARTLLDFAEAMGAAPTPVAFAEVYLALQTNQVDGQENPLPTIDAMKFYEVQDYISLTGHVVVDQLVLMNEDKWQSLSEGDRQLVQDAILAGGEVNDQIVNDGEANLLAFFEEQGLTVVTPDVEPMRAAMQPVYDALDEQFGEGMVAEIMAVK